MTNITDKVKDKLKDAKDKVTSTTKEGAAATKETMTDAKDKVTSTTKEGAGGTTYQRAKDPTQEYDEKEPMSPAKIKQHEPTAVRRDPSEVNIVEPGKQSTSSQDAAEKARRSGMTKGTAGAAESST
jgi:hypothetical protein